MASAPQGGEISTDSSSLLVSLIVIDTFFQRRDDELMY